MTQKNPLVSVVIPSKNEGIRIKKTLSSIKRQKYRNIEIILVDSSDDDRTSSVAKKFTDKIIRKKVNIPQAKNLGAKYAKGQIYLFIDADAILSSNWVNKGLEYLLDEKYDVFIGGVRSIEKGFRAYILCGVYRIELELLRIIKSFGMGTLPLMVTKKFFKKINGFKEDLVHCEDIEFIRRLKRNGRVKIDKKIISLISMRRFEKKGYIKGLWEWSVIGIYYIIKNKPFYTRNYPIVR